MSEPADQNGVKGFEAKDNLITRKEGQNGANHGNKVRDNRKKKISCKEKKWTCEGEPLWRVYMKSYLEREEKLEDEDKYDRRKATLLPRFPNVKSSEHIPPPATYPCFPLNTFNLKDRARLPDRLNPQEKIRIWRSMKKDPAVDTSSFLPEVVPKISRTDSEKWPGLWPCVEQDLAGEFRRSEKLLNRKRKGLLPCQKDTDDESDPDVPGDDFADHKELGHARIPIICQSIRKSQRVDRAAGERPGLVDGDYVVFVYDSRDNGEGRRSYANVCLRGLKGMHLAELSSRRVREKTWKFCFYQAIVALLAKTQLRYKFAWSVNIDYIFDHAWMLFAHMGSMNVKEKIRLDDVVVYNYKYSVELELVHETKDSLAMPRDAWNYVEDDLKKMLELERPELMKTTEKIGSERPKPREPSPVHEITREIEEWFDDLPDIYRNCVFRTGKFSLAFWKDGTFWYLFNPYRCDEFGLWCGEGYACMMKFCTRNSLKRHLMILMIRAYSYESQSPLKLVGKNGANGSENNEDKNVHLEAGNKEPESIVDERSGEKSPSISKDPEENTKSKAFTVQIYQMIYHCVQIHNVKLLQKKPPDPRAERGKKKNFDDCDTDPHSPYEPCAQDAFSADFEDEDDGDMDMEKRSWLTSFKLTWTRFAAPKKKTTKQAIDSKLRWHQFYVEEPNKIFSLWGEIHPTEGIFAKENRGKQAYACYVVCAGMTRIQAPEYWSPKTLDAVVMCGDRYYTLSKLHSETAATREEFDVSSGCERYLDGEFKIGETLFEAEVLPAVCGRLYSKRSKYLWMTVEQMFLKHHFAILTCENSCLVIFKFCGAYYMVDVHSIGPPLFQYGAGVAYMIRATSFFKFMTVLVLTIGSSECSRFTLNPIVIGKVVDLGTTDVENTKGKAKFRRIECPYDDGPKGSKKTKSDKKPTIDRVSCRKNGCGN